MRTNFFLAEKTIDLDIESRSLANVFLFDGWLVFPLMDEEDLVWFEKEWRTKRDAHPVGQQDLVETMTTIDELTQIKINKY